MAYDRTNTFTLGKNKRKEKDTHPSHTGSINIDGVEYWLSAWVKEHNGEKFFSGSVKPKEERTQKSAQGHAQSNNGGGNSQSGDFDDDLPFAHFEKGSIV